MPRFISVDWEARFHNRGQPMLVTPNYLLSNCRESVGIGSPAPKVLQVAVCNRCVPAWQHVGSGQVSGVKKPQRGNTLDKKENVYSVPQKYLVLRVSFYWLALYYLIQSWKDLWIRKFSPSDLRPWRCKFADR